MTVRDLEFGSGPSGRARPPAPVDPAGSSAQPPHSRRVPVAVLAVLGGLIVATLTYDAFAHSALHRAQDSLASAHRRLDRTRSNQASTAARLISTTAVRNQRRRAIAETIAEIGGANQNLNAASRTTFFQTLDIATLHTCLSGVSGAVDAVTFANLAGAVSSITAASSACLSLDGSNGGLVYPFDFPDPFVMTVGSEYYAFATNSAAGNIQIIQSADLTHWATVGDALPHLAPWAQPGATWAPSVLQRGSTFVLYYSALYGSSNEQCISEAVATQPQGPYVDDSQWPIACQLALGGSIDPSPFVDTNGTPYLLWKSQGANGQPATLWSQQLSPDGTALLSGAPTSLLQPDQGWQHGYIEGPDMIQSDGHYLLFYSGSDWKTATYAIGYADCSGPTGPCTDESSQSLVASQPGLSGPGGPSLFTDTQGSLWVTFHAWLPGKVGFPNSRPLFLRRVTVSGGVPQVAL